MIHVRSTVAVHYSLRGRWVKCGDWLKIPSRASLKLDYKKVVWRPTPSTTTLLQDSKVSSEYIFYYYCYDNVNMKRVQEGSGQDWSLKSHLSGWFVAAWLSRSVCWCLQWPGSLSPRPSPLASFPGRWWELRKIIIKLLLLYSYYFLIETSYYMTEPDTPLLNFCKIC